MFHHSQNVVLHEKGKPSSSDQVNKKQPSPLHCSLHRVPFAARFFFFYQFSFGGNLHVSGAGERKSGADQRNQGHALVSIKTTEARKAKTYYHAMKRMGFLSAGAIVSLTPPLTTLRATERQLIPVVGRQ